MITKKIIPNDFKTSLRNARKNTLLFENILDIENLNDEISVVQHPLLNNYIYSHLRGISERINISSEEERRMRFRPKLVSVKHYDTIDFWYLILFVNNFNSPNEFKFFDELFIPDHGDMIRLIDDYLRKKRREK